MDVAQLKEQAARVEQGLDQLRQLHSKVGARLSKINQLDPANHPAEASSHESLLVHTQLSFLESYVNAAVTQLSSVESGLSGAVDALAAAPTPPPANSSAAAGTDQQPQARRSSYRLVHRSSIPPSVYEGPARRRLSRDELSNVFGHLQPWELTHYRRPLGTRLFNQSAANYTNPVIDCEDDKARRMWAAMPLAVAQRLGQRATNIREIKHRYPEDCECWCLGTWVALVEGHASGRAAIAAKKKREREGGEGTAAAAAGQADGSGQSADDGTLETVDNIPLECISARADRQWRTPAVTTLIVGTDLDLSSYDEEEWDGLEAWVGGCDAIEVLDLKRIYFTTTEGLLSALPADGKSLAALRTLRGVSMDEAVWMETDKVGIDRLREVMVARGVKRSVRELKITVRRMPSRDGAVTWSESAARLIEAVAAPEVVWEEVFAPTDDSTSGRIDAELLSLSSSTGTLPAQKLIVDYAKTAGTVTYSGCHETTPNAITDDAFAAAHTLRLVGDALADSDKKNRAVDIASKMPNLARIEAPHRLGETLTAPVREVWRFLERLQTARESRGRAEKSLSYVGLTLPPGALAISTDNPASPCLWDPDIHQLPPIAEVCVDVLGMVADDRLEAFYNGVMATVVSFTSKLKGHTKSTVQLCPGMMDDFRQRFLVKGLNINAGPYQLSIFRRTLLVERRT
ncbi:unnamed protein product [Vitrella brassicaformis CCMP3155]|uniref:Uncharacterized protein n=1 Tax=Vitrella brassicaformis (strain CCMP3155) TaxID=1169540 RepID=A0A0G4GNI8_VITBC|nr:unnamed protein product [Vitrella brassicaformis CCMP3155]|eukprot:CEM31862.1 unnamed protein product [Vitrella brassicaformis CCMP3155]